MVVSEIDHNVPEMMSKATRDTTKSHPEKVLFTVEILKLVKDCQQQHGLRHGDYSRYRGYCTRRIGRLRHVLKLPQGDRRHFKKRDVNESHITNTRGDARYLHIPLMQAERNWAYAMQLKQEANTEPRKKFHFIQKLRKACSYSILLEELSKLDKCDARTKLEAQAYVAWMQGTLLFDLQLWAKATENLKKAQVIYEKLASALPEDEQSPYTLRVEEITPSLRYCAYNIGDDKAVDLLELRSQGILENFDALMSQTMEKTATVLHQITWFGINVPIRIDRVKIFLLSIESLDDSISRAETTQAKIKIIEDMFIDLRDIITEVRKDPKEQLVLSYLLSIRIDRTVERNFLLIRQTKKSQDVCRLLDIVIQQTNELMQFEPLLANATAQTNYSNQICACRVLRAFYMAKTHAVFRRWKEATATFDLCISRFNEIGKTQPSGMLKDMMAEVCKKAEIEKAVSHAHAALEKCEEEAPPIPQKQHKSKKPLLDRLDEFREDPQLLTRNPNVIPVPIPMTPVPPKPLFYDLALNYVQMPSTLKDIAEGSKKEQKQSGGVGISSFVKGLWGWGQK